MPGGDRTGPNGEGPRTGRQLGLCSGYDSPGYTRPAGGRAGRGFGFAAGRANRGYSGSRGGRRVGYAPRAGRPFPAYDTVDYMPADIDRNEIEALRAESSNLEAQLIEIKRRLEAIEKKGGGENG